MSTGRPTALALTEYRLLSKRKAVALAQRAACAAGLRHRGRQRVESVEASAIGNELRPLLLKDVPDRPTALFGKGVRLGPDDTFVDEPGVRGSS